MRILKVSSEDAESPQAHNSRGESVRRIGAPSHSEESNTQQRAVEGEGEEEEYAEEEKDRKQLSSGKREKKKRRHH